MNSGSFESLNCRTRCGRSPCARQMRCAELTETPAALAIIAPVQCVASLGGSCSVRATTRSATSCPSRGMREGLGNLVAGEPHPARADRPSAEVPDWAAAKQSAALRYKFLLSVGKLDKAAPGRRQGRVAPGRILS